MGGKVAQSSSQIQIPPEIMARYNAVNAQAEQAGSQPFQQYSTNPNAFVAPLTATQTAGIGNVNSAQGTYAPYGNAAVSALGGASMAADPLQAQAAGNINSGLGAGQSGTMAAVGAGQSYLNPASSLTAASAGAVNPTALGAAQIGQYMSPYNSSVVQSTLAALQQQQGQDQSTLQGQQIMSGAFGGSRAALDQANLARQQGLTTAQTVSGLENQNYAQALGAAQQQQGVGLSAAQANRSALGTAGAQLGQLGQQDYSQLSGAANQLYTQGLGAAGAQQGLGQQVYGQGVTNATTLSGLGTTAQSNQINAGNAQIAAGTTQQQTQQAGLQALYNQFLQQQGYPFQVAQFEAGVAEGTGALSGSTTTSTQPTSFFGGLSDARMKENIEPIGKTFDGQNIVKFRYKGKKKTEVGLIAQDVERQMPDAVQEHHGLKYVDYDRATKRAAARGHFADGGSAYDPGTMAEVLRIQKAMYPFGSESGSRTGGGSGPWGTSLSPSGGNKLMTAEAPKIKNPTLKDVSDDAGAVDSLAGDAKDAYKFAQSFDDNDHSYDPKQGEIDNAASGNFFYRGGLVRRKRAAGGGMPYGIDDPYVPSDDDQLPDPQKLKSEQNASSGNGGKGGGSSTLQDIQSMAKIAETAAMFMYRGGLVHPRKGYADAGVVNDDLPQAGSWTDGSPTDYTDSDLDDLASKRGLGPADTKPKNVVVPTESHAFANTLRKVGSLFGIGNNSGDQPPAAPATPTPTPRRLASLPTTNVGPVPHQPAGIAAAPSLGAANMNQPPSDPTQALPAATPSQPSSNPFDDAGAPTKDWFSRHQSWLVPLLKGVGTMAASPSRYLGSALLQGAGAAAGSYEDVQNQMTKRENVEEQTQAGYTGQLPASIRGYRIAGKDANGKWVYEPVTSEFSNPNAAGVATYGTSSGVNGQPRTIPVVAKTDGKNYSFDVGPSDQALEPLKKYGIDPKTDPTTNLTNVRSNVALASQDADAEKRTSDRLQASPNLETQHYDLLNLVNSAASSSRTGIMAQGRGHDAAAPVVGMVNWAARAMGIPPPDGLNQAETADQIVDKVTSWLGTRSADIAGQHNQAVAQALATALPRGTLTPEAVEKLGTGLLRASQQERDFQQYAPAYAAKTGVHLGIDNAFKQDMTPELEREGSQVQRMMENKHAGGPSDFELAVNNRTNLNGAAKKYLADKYGPEALRWLNVP